MRVNAQGLRASLGGWDKRPPRLSIEGTGLTFTAAPGARPPPVTAAKGLQLHTRPDRTTRARSFLELDQASAAPGSLIGRPRRRRAGET